MNYSKLAFAVSLLSLGTALYVALPQTISQHQVTAQVADIESPMDIGETKISPVPGTVVLTEERVREILRSEIAANPKVILDSLNAFVQTQQVADALAVNQKAVDNKASIGATADLPFYGNKDGKIELVYFYDVNCAFCKRLDPTIKRLVSENPELRVTHREIPILTPSSRFAAHIEGLVWEKHPDRYNEFHDSLMGHQGALADADIEGKLREILGAEETAKIVATALDSKDTVSQKVNKRIEDNLALASASGITGTPFVYVLKGDGLLRGAGDDAYDQLAGMIKKAEGSAAN